MFLGFVVWYGIQENKKNTRNVRLAKAQQGMTPGEGGK